MIYKDIDPLHGTSKFEQAGYAAEKEMAFFLRRFFKDSQEVDVLNSLRIELGGEIAQIDHLILMPHGLLIVESKSVAGKVQIKDDGQWIRWYDNQSKGMRSPITQAHMQGMLLKELLGSGVKQKGAFDQIPVDVLVAISDNGVILWSTSGTLPEVCKADQVPDRVKSKLTQYAAKPLSAENRRKIADFLCVSHRPVVAPTANPVALTIAEPVVQYVASPIANAQKLDSSVLTCKHCHACNVEIRYKHNYFLYCQKCNQNTALKPPCASCGKPARIRKDGKQFFVDCADCNTSQPYYINP
ncbi:MAG: NERD domain-containing protein [Gallionella sp.]|nr:NERD domain-containing protein [Gallionella sp.]MDD4959218.1 NERD domain-containing protein [Gallionella sp.]